MPASLIDSTPQIYGNAIFLRWGDFRSLFVANNVPIFYAFDTIKYTVFMQIGPILFACELVASSSSPNITWDASYPQSQNDLDVAEFTGQWQLKANLPSTSISDEYKAARYLADIVRYTKKMKKELKKLRRTLKEV